MDTVQLLLHTFTVAQGLLRQIEADWQYLLSTSFLPCFLLRAEYIWHVLENTCSLALRKLARNWDRLYYGLKAFDKNMGSELSSFNTCICVHVHHGMSRDFPLLTRPGACLSLTISISPSEPIATFKWSSNPDVSHVGKNVDFIQKSFQFYLFSDNFVLFTSHCTCVDCCDID